MDEELLTQDQAWKSEYRKERLMTRDELPDVISKSEEEVRF